MRKPRLPTSIQRASGASARSAGSASESNSTTSASRKRAAPRSVIRSASPGPAPMKTTRPALLVGLLVGVAWKRANSGFGSATSPW